MSSTAIARWRAAVIAGAPALLLLGFAYHPYIGNPTDDAAVASAAADGTVRWGLAHLAIGIGYGLMALAFVAVRSFLREAGEERWSGVGMPFTVLGSCLLIPLVGMEFAPLAAVETGGDAEAVQEELRPWFLPLLISGALSTAVGALCIALAIVRSGALPSAAARVAVSGLAIMAVARFVPLGAGQVVVGIGAVVALWPVARAVLQDARSAARGQAATISPA